MPEVKHSPLHGKTASEHNVALSVSCNDIVLLLPLYLRSLRVEGSPLRSTPCEAGSTGRHPSATLRSRSPCDGRWKEVGVDDSGWSAWSIDRKARARGVGRRAKGRKLEVNLEFTVVRSVTLQPRYYNNVKAVGIKPVRRVSIVIREH